MNNNNHRSDAYWAIAGVLTDAENGDPQAQCAVAERFWYGDLVSKDSRQAVYWYTQAANQSHSYAQCCLAYAYATGNGTAVDPVQAAYWYRQAANQGYLIGVRSLAACYARGFGVPKDPALAYEWACKALHLCKGSAMTEEGFDRP